MADLVPFPRAPVGDVVALLERALDRASRGEIVGVALACHVRGETSTETGSAFEIGDGDVAHLVCAIERVKLRMLTTR